MVKLKVKQPFTFDRPYEVGEVVDITDLKHFPQPMLTNRIANGFLEYVQEPVVSQLEETVGSDVVTGDGSGGTESGRSFRLPDEK